MKVDEHSLYLMLGVLCQSQASSTYQLFSIGRRSAVRPNASYANRLTHIGKDDGKTDTQY